MIAPDTAAPPVDPAAWRDPLFPSRSERFLPYLSRDGEGALRICGHDAEALLKDFGSPLLTYLPNRVAENVARVLADFGQHFSDVSVHYALKSCYYAPCAEAALAAGAGVEVMSDLELQIAEQVGFAPEATIVNGLGRDPEFLTRGVRAAGSLHVLDTWEDFAGLVRTAEREDAVVDVAVRAVPTMPDDLADMMPRDSKLGQDASGADFWRMCAAAAEHPRMRLRGLHGHQFTRAASPSDYGLFVGGLARVAVEALRVLGMRFEYLDIGGGFNTRSVLETRGMSLADFARVAAAELSVIPYEFRLVTEPGRYLVGDAAVGLTRVRATKQRDGFTWTIVDLATNTLIPVPGAEYFPVSVRGGAGPGTLSRLGDGTCAPSVLCADVELPEAVPGDPLALLNCGAYTTVFAHVWGPRPPTVLALKDGAPPAVLTSAEQFSRAAHAVYGHRLALGHDV